MSETVRRWRESGLAWWPLGLAMLVLDQITKEVIVRLFSLHDSKYVLPVLDIVRAHNYGAAFSFLDRAGGAQRWVFTVFAVVVGIGLLIALRRTPGKLQRLQNAGFMLVASGALGNAIDRVRYGYVVDFVHAHWNAAYFPAFNVADSCITVGAGLVILDALLEWRRERRVASGKVD
jgi:signal peptidase II